MAGDFFSAEELADLRDLEVSALFEQVAIWRSPPRVGGKVAPPTEIAADVPAQIMSAERAQQLGLAVPGLAGGRAALVGLLPYGTDLQEGDELHQGTATYYVEGVGRQLTVVACALSEARGDA